MVVSGCLPGTTASFAGETLQIVTAGVVGLFQRFGQADVLQCSAQMATQDTFPGRCVWQQKLFGTVEASSSRNKILEALLLVSSNTPRRALSRSPTCALTFVDEPLVNTCFRTITELDAAVADRCCNLFEDRSTLPNLTNFQLVAKAKQSELVTRKAYKVLSRESVSQPTSCREALE